MGRHQTLSGRRVARGRQARHGGDLLPRRRRRQWAAPARRGPHLRAVGHRLPDDRGVPVHPQHVRVDDRQVRHRGTTQVLGAAAGADGRHRQLLPHRARRRIRRQRVEHPRRQARRRLRARRRQAVHLRRGGLGRLRGDGPHRRRGPARHLGLHRRKGHGRAEFRRTRGEDGLARPTHRAGDPGGGARTGRRDAGRRGRRGFRLRHRDERPQRRPAQHRGVLARRRPGRLRQGGRLRTGTARRSVRPCSTSPPSGSPWPTWPPGWKRRE